MTRDRPAQTGVLAMNAVQARTQDLEQSNRSLENGVLTSTRGQARTGAQAVNKGGAFRISKATYRD